jgi:hypothetical protein
MPTSKKTAAKPRLGSNELKERLTAFNIDYAKYPLIIVGIRGYYKTSMGAPNINDRGIYDDAIFIYTPSVFAAFNANTDPSVYRKKTTTKKGIASLIPGAWYVHKFDVHRGAHSQYPAICQRLGTVTVLRDGVPPYKDTGNFGINIHRGGNTTTSSEGCQTILPDQWDSFYNLAKDQAKRYYGDNWNKKVIPYILLEE